MNAIASQPGDPEIKALAVYWSSLPAVVVVETLTAHETGGALTAESPTGYAVFAAGNNRGDAVPELLRNGNWHFGSFNGNRIARLNNQAACLACHKPQAGQSFLFTYGALQAQARR